MTKETVSIWLISNFGDNYQYLLGLPLIVVIVLNILHAIFADRREFMHRERNNKSVLGFLFGIASGFLIIFTLDYLSVAIFDYNPLNNLQNFFASIRV